MGGRKRHTAPPKPKTWRWTCPACGKRSFPTRKVARQQLRRIYPGEVAAMQVYQCSTEGGLGWHFGHPNGHEREREPVTEE